MNRFLTTCFILFALVLLAPVVILTAFLVYFMLGKPIIFCQLRPGMYGVPFKLYKFRSMTDDRDHSGELLPDSMRLNSFGKFLRSTSMDELPSFINILKGEMALVGPRPLLMEYMELYTPEQARRHTVLPGLTGWSQVNGRNNLSWEQKFKMDCWYVDNKSLMLDLRIVGLTALKVISRKNINAPGEASMSKFTGSESE